MTFAEMLNKAFNEPDYASLVVSDPYAALSQVGFDPTQDQVDALRAATQAMLAAKEALGDKNANV